MLPLSLFRPQWSGPPGVVLQRFTEITSSFHRDDAYGTGKTSFWSISIVIQAGVTDDSQRADMLNATSELQFSSEENTAISQLASLALSGDAAANEKYSTGLPEKSGYPDSVYVMAANIFQSIQVEKFPDKVLIKYGNEPLRSLYESEDESLQRLSYELAFSALKCE